MKSSPNRSTCAATAISSFIHVSILLRKLVPAPTYWFKDCPSINVARCFLPISFQTSCAMAGHTNASSVRLKPRIIFTKLMSLMAVRFARVDRTWTNTSKYVFSICNGFQMRGINAFSDTAKVIKYKTIRNRSFYNLICNAMSRAIPPVNTESTISIGLSSQPKPACPCFSNLTPEPRFNLWCHDILIPRFILFCKPEFI